MGTGITKYVLKHPVTTVMALLCLIVFGITSVFLRKAGADAGYGDADADCQGRLFRRRPWKIYASL